MNRPVHPVNITPTPEDLTTFANLVRTARLVIFDFDGVIADSEVISLSSLQGALRDFGIALTPAETRNAFLGTSLRTITAHVAKNGTRNANGFPEAWESALFERFAKELQPVPQVFELIGHLRDSQTPFCVASSSTFRRIEAALSAMDMSDRFQHVFSAEQVARGKPAPDLFELAASKMKVDPCDCVVIEDSPHGVRAAKAANMHAIGFVGGQHLIDFQFEHGALLREAGAEIVLPTFEGLAQLDITG